MSTIELINKMDFFKGFTQEEVELIFSICKEEFYSKDSLIFKENSPADKFYLVIYGQIKISHDLEKLGEEELVILDKGECFGEMALMDGGPRSASAIAEIDTKLLSIDKNDVSSIMRKDNAIAVKILMRFCAVLSARLRDANKQISEMTGLFMSFRTKKNDTPDRADHA